MSNLYAESAARFARDTADHELTILQDAGLYRHLRFQAPKRGFYWFDLITWPGHLAVVGDVDHGYMFARVEDMFDFFRSPHLHPDYWAEKIRSGGSVKDYSEKECQTLINEAVQKWERDVYPDKLVAYEADLDACGKSYPRLASPPVAPTPPAQIREMIAGWDLSYEASARDLLGELEQLGVASDTWEWDLSDWDWSYLWQCHAIRWGIARYDEAKTGGAS